MPCWLGNFTCIFKSWWKSGWEKDGQLPTGLFQISLVSNFQQEMIWYVKKTKEKQATKNQNEISPQPPTWKVLCMLWNSKNRNPLFLACKLHNAPKSWWCEVLFTPSRINTLICLGLNPRPLMIPRPCFFMGFKYLIFISFSRSSRFSSLWESRCMKPQIMFTCTNNVKMWGCVTEDL